MTSAIKNKTIKTEPLNGWLILNKSRGPSSNDAVQKVKRLVGKNNKVGHAGTLAPLAEGVLPIAIGEATKTVQYIMDATKEYEFTITWGQERSTGDLEGEVTAESDYIPSENEIKNIIPKFIGRISQIPPAYSALKINGQPAYKLARKGIEVELKPREIEIYDLFLMDITCHVERSEISRESHAGSFGCAQDEEKSSATFRVKCGKGTYVRTLAVDIARSLGTCGYVSFLKRTRVGNFFIKDAILLDNLIKVVHNAESNLPLVSVNYGLSDILGLEITADQTKALRNGLSIFLDEYSKNSESIVQILNDGKLQALAKLEKGLCKPIRVFNL